MQVTEVCREQKEPGEMFVKYEVGNLLVRLTDTYNNDKPFEDLLYVIACRKLAEQAGKTARQHCVKDGSIV